MDPEAVPYYFIHGYVPEPDTWYRGVTHVEPGTTLIVTADGATERRTYWRLQFPDASEPPAMTDRPAPDPASVPKALPAEPRTAPA